MNEFKNETPEYVLIDKALHMMGLKLNHVSSKYHNDSILDIKTNVIMNCIGINDFTVTKDLDKISKFLSIKYFINYNDIRYLRIPNLFYQKTFEEFKIILDLMS